MCDRCNISIKSGGFIIKCRKSKGHKGDHEGTLMGKEISWPSKSREENLNDFNNIINDLKINIQKMENAIKNLQKQED